MVTSCCIPQYTNRDSEDSRSRKITFHS